MQAAEMISQPHDLLEPLEQSHAAKYYLLHGSYSSGPDWIVSDGLSWS